MRHNEKHSQDVQQSTKLRSMSPRSKGTTLTTNMAFGQSHAERQEDYTPCVERHYLRVNGPSSTLERKNHLSEMGHKNSTAGEHRLRILGSDVRQHSHSTLVRPESDDPSIHIEWIDASILVSRFDLTIFKEPDPFMIPMQRRSR